jgi:polar amino acid transport system ATP-binding protein
LVDSTKLNGVTLSVEAISKTFDGHRVLTDVSFIAESGQVVCIVGPSGSGKSTLLRCINLLTPPDSGSVSLSRERLFAVRNGIVETAVEPRMIRQSIGFVAQEWNLWPNMTVIENISEGLRVVRGFSKSEAIARAEQLCALVQLSDRLSAYPGQLSGGQKQRVAIARALAMEPSVLMLDEVTSALDPVLVAGILDVIASLRDAKRILLVVTHHISFARDVADTVLFLAEGSVKEAGPANELLRTPATQELANFIGILKRSW